MNIIRLFVILLITSLTAFAHDIPLAKYLVKSPSTKVMNQIAADYEVLRRTSEGFEIYVPANKISAFLKLVPKAQYLPEESFNKSLLAGYRDMASVTAELKAIAAQYPDITRLETYGKTDKGLPLYVLKISDNVDTDEDEPELMITSATHGDELITVEVTMELFQLMLKNYGKDARMTKFIQDREIYFIPVINPDGYSNRSRYANNVDPNRDYPYPGKETKKSVDCIDALIKFFHSRNFVGSMDIHASGQLVMFPWAYTRDNLATAEQTSFQNLVDHMAEMNKYTAGQISRVIYVAKGSSADYYYWKNQTVAVAVELTTTKVPSAQKIPAVVEEAKEMIWRFIEHF